MAYVPGMPSDVWNKLPEKKKKEIEDSYKKQQEQKKSSAPTIRVPGENPYGMPGVKVVEVSEDALDPTKQKTSIPSNIPAVQRILSNTSFDNQKKDTQSQANQSFIEQLTNRTLGADASKLASQTNIAAVVVAARYAAKNNETFQQFVDRAAIQSFDANTAYEKLPTSERNKIAALMQSSDRPIYRVTSEVYKLVQDHEAEYQQRKLKEMEESQFWEADQHQFVTYATAADWYNMQRIGYDQVYIEDGSAPLKNKGGVYTIGRDKLSGVPKDVRTVLVDTQGNWRYIADTGKRASYVEEMQNLQYANNIKYASKLDKAQTTEQFTRYKLEQLLKEASKLERKLNKTRSKEDFAAYQAVLEQAQQYNQWHDNASDNLNNIVTAWAIKQDSYDKAIKVQTKYTAEDEARYQALKKALDNIADVNNTGSLELNQIHRTKLYEDYLRKQKDEHTAEIIAEFSELSKRREDSRYSPVFINQDTKAYFDRQVDYMKKSVDQFNLWDDATIHAENGEALGDQLKRLFLRDMLGWDNTSQPVADLGSPTDNYMATVRDIREADSSHFVEDIKGIGNTIAKTIWKPFAAARTANKRAEQAYWDAEQQIKDITQQQNAGKISDKEAADAIQQLRTDQFAYLNIQKDAFSQAGSILFSNVMNDLSVFDLLSVQSAFVAWRMAAHPERYSNDPKFKKMQDAFKAIYGEDYRGAMDAGKMAMAMIDIKAGTSNFGTELGNDFIYLDASDLRHASGEKYGFWASLGVGIGTDIGAVVGLAKTAVGAITKVGGAKVLAKSATDTLEQSIARSKGSALASKFIKESGIQKNIYKDIKASIKRSFKGDIDDLKQTVVQQVKQRAEVFKGKMVDEITGGFQEARYTEFLDDLGRTLENSESLTHTVLMVNKGTTVAKTLGTIDDALDSAQRSLFKIACPVAGAVTFIAKANKEIKALKNLGLASPETLEALFRNSEDLKASITKLSFNSVLDGTMFRKQQEEILDSFNWNAMSDLKHKIALGKQYRETIKRFSNYKDGYMRSVANNYVASVVNKLNDTISKAHGLDELEKLAKLHEFNSFDEMFTTIKANISDMYKYSAESEGIVKAFEGVYDTKITQRKIGQLKDYMENATNHVDCVKAALNSKGVSILSDLNAETHPALVQGTAKIISNSIHDFMYTINNDFLSYADKLGNPVSLHEIALHAMDVLDDVAYGAIDKESLAKARDAVQEYLDELNSTYMKNLSDWHSNIIQDVFGVQDYLGDIEKAIPNYSGSREVLSNVQNGFIEYFKKKGANVTQEDLNTIIRSNEKELGEEFAKMSMEQRQSVVYRIMENKGTQTLGQISDANLEVVTNQLTDCNSQLNKNLRLLQDYIEGEAANQRITDAIVNASGMENTRILNSVLQDSSVDSTMHMAIMDVISGHSGAINYIVQTEPTDIAVSKVREYILREAKKQLALHNGTYKTFRNVVSETMDVAENALNMEKYLDNVPPEEDCIDICVSIVRSADGASPKDIAFHTRGAKDAPTVFRKKGKFAVFDNDFAGRAYGKSAQQITDEYAALSITDELTPDEWRKQLQDYITQQKELALKENKTLRFIGFNSSDAVTGNNKYLSDVLRSCGVSANMGNSVDLADFMRANAGEYVFDSKDISALNRGLRNAIENAKSKSISLGISPSIAYDPKYNCADIIVGALDKHKFVDKEISENAQYIVNSLKTIDANLGTKAYNEVGDAMGTYLDLTAFERKLQDLNIADGVNAKQDLMRIISEATAAGEPQLGINKIIDTAIDEPWIDTTKISGTALNLFSNAEKAHETVLQLNSMFNSIHRMDLIKDSDLDKLMYIYKETITSLPHNTHARYMSTIIKAEELTAQQLYVVNRWMLDQLYTVDPTKFDKVYGRILINARKQASYLSDVGYTFVRTNVADYTEESMDAFFVKYLDESEESFAFSQDLRQLHLWNKDQQTLGNYLDSVDALYSKHKIHGVQDKLVALQMAEVHAPIKNFQNEMQRTYNHAYRMAIKDLNEEAAHYTVKKVKGKYSREMIEKEATRRGVAAARRYVQERGEVFRSSAVSAVANLNEEALKVHLIRNCCGGMIIDPSSKVVDGLDLATLFDKWKSYGIKIDEIEFTHGAIQNRKLFRISYMPEGMSADDIFAKYDNASVKFVNPQAASFDRGMRHTSFGASDGTLMDVQHQQNFRDLFFSDSPDSVLRLDENFKSWRNELYSCNMWADADLKQLVNPYYTDNLLNNLAQNTHQLRNNITAVHDFSTIMNNRYMNTRYILSESRVFDPKKSIAEQRQTIIDQLTAQKQKLCVISYDKHNHLKLIDYTPRLNMMSTNDKFFEKILNNTVMLDEAMFAQLADYTKSTNVALSILGSNTPELLSTAYGLYKKTIRNATITMYLYGNIGTAIRNMVDSSTKGLAETLQYDESVEAYMRYYRNSVNDVLSYSNTYHQIEETLGRVNHETINKFFAGNEEELRKFNIFYGYENMCGGDDLVASLSRKETAANSRKFFMEDTNFDTATADSIRKTIDRVYASPRYYGMTNAQLEKHMMEIHDVCMQRLRDSLKLSDDEFEEISKRFWDYTPTVESWGDKLSRFPVLAINKRAFNNAETRARLAVYRTFLEGGASEYEAMKHVTSTQFHYAGLGNVEEFFPFTQYKLYNALYWFDHANMHTVSTAWRAAQYNDDGAMTNQEISAMIARYRQQEYYLYDAGIDQEYDNYFENNLTVAGHILFDGIDSNLGIPRTFNAGNLDLNGTHYLKLGNSFVDEIDMVLSCVAGAFMFGSTIGRVGKADNTADRIRLAYESLRYTPLYDSFYSPWKSYFDLIAYAYDKNKITDSSEAAWRYYDEFMASKSMHSEAISMLPVIGAVLSNLVGREKSFDLNLGQLMALWSDPDAKKNMFSFAQDTLCDIAGMFVPSAMGTKVEGEQHNPYKYSASLLHKMLIDNPTTYFDIQGRLQREMGFTEDQAKEIWESMKVGWDIGDYESKIDYYHIARDLYSRGFTKEEITNLFKQNNLPELKDNVFMYLTNGLPGYLKYDKAMRTEIKAYYKSLGMSTEQAWAKLILNPAVIRNGRVVEISRGAAEKLSNERRAAYDVLKGNNFTDKDWDAYWDSMPYRYPKGKWSETYKYLRNAGYSANEARTVLLHGYMLDDNGNIVDVQGRARTQVYSSSTLQGAEWDAYWNTVPNYTKYEKGAYGRAMKKLKGMGYTDEQARAQIQQGFYVDAAGNVMNVLGKERPVLGYSSFNSYYQTLPDYIKYEKGAFTRTYQTLKQLGYDYDTSLKLIQQGAYLMNVTAAPSVYTEAMGRSAAVAVATRNMVVTDITTLLQKHGSVVIESADGNKYMLVDCSGLQRPRKTFAYSRGGFGEYSADGSGTAKRKRKPKYVPKPQYVNYFTRKPFLQQGNVSTFTGFTNYRGSNKIGKPYTTKGYVSTYSAQNFLDGASYGMRKTYKIDMRQFKSGALSTKSAYPASYRNIAVAYRHNLYKDLYAKYGMSRIKMRANQASYSNAAIVRLRRNEIYNRERYAERRDKKATEKKVTTRAAR